MPLIFKLQINTGNADYEGDNIAHALKENLRDVATALLSGSMAGNIRDQNGNITGKYYFEREA